MVLPMVGGEYLGTLWRGTTGKLKMLARPLLKDGIGDRMDKGNLWVVPGFTLLVFAILWTTKLSKVALEESTCRGASIYNFEGTQLDEDAKRHCQTAKRYFVGPDEPFSLEHSWRRSREVKNPEWILWFWAPIVFVMYVLTRFMWTLLLENQGINFGNVVSASQSIIVEHDSITEIDEEKLADRLPVIVENFRCAYSSRAYAAFILFECSLVAAPLLLLFFVLPLMIGGAYRSWGLDIARAWWERREWQGSPLVPFFDWSSEAHRRPLVPLIPRITYCDYHFVSLGNSHTLTYRCYLDANWHERTALFTWAMLVFLALINLSNLFFWAEWTVRMRFRKQRRGWVIKKWLNADGFNEAELALMFRFAESFKMGQLLYFYYIEAHTDRVVSSAFCTALFARWLEKRQRRKQSALEAQSYAISMTPGPGGGGEGDGPAPPPPHYYQTTLPLLPKEISSNYGWNIGMEMHPMRPVPTAPYPTPPTGASFSDVSTAQMRGSRSQSIMHSPRSPPGDAYPPELAMGTPSTSALVGRRKARAPNFYADIGRDSICRGDEEERRAEMLRRAAQQKAEREQREREQAERHSKCDEDEEEEEEEDSGPAIVTDRKPKGNATKDGIATERQPLIEAHAADPQTQTKANPGRQGGTRELAVQTQHNGTPPPKGQKGHTPPKGGASDKSKVRPTEQQKKKSPPRQKGFDEEEEEEEEWK